MPDFISSSSDSDRYLAAKIGDEILTRTQLSRAKENFIQQRFKGQSLPEHFKKQIEGQVFDQLIKNKVNLILMKKIGLYPIHRSKKYIMVKYLKEKFSSYFTETTQNFNKFNQEILLRNRISYSDLESQVVDAYASQDGLDLLDSIQYFSKPEVILFWDAEQIKISYEISVIQGKEKVKILKQRASISEANIQEKFKKDYLSKDKKAKLTSTKRQAIKNSLYKEKEKKLEQNLIEEIQKSLKNNSLRQVASQYNSKVQLIRNVNLASKLNDKKLSGLPSLTTLDESKAFRSFLASSKINKGTIIAEKNNLYLVSIINIISPKKDIGHKALQELKVFKKFLEKHKKKISDDNDKILKRYKTITETITELEKKRITIKRFL